MQDLMDFAEMDLRGAFDFAIMIEEDAQLRYEQLSRLLGNDPGGAGDVCRTMVWNERKHRIQLTERRAAIFRDEAPRIELSVMAEGVERPLVDDDDLPRTAREALEVALAAEKRACDFYRRVVPHVSDSEVRALFQELAQEEVEHGELLAQKIAKLEVSAGERPPPRPSPAPEPSESFPDRAQLEAVLRRFDAATQAVAVGVIVKGMRPDEVASVLGVSRRTVSSKLARFLGIARQHVAIAVAAAALTGCGGGLAMTDAPGRSIRAEMQRDSAEAVEGRAAPGRAEGVGDRDQRAGEGDAATDLAEIEPLRPSQLDRSSRVAKPEDDENDVVPPTPAFTPPTAAEVKPSPAIEDVWPDKAPASEGARVEIRGKNLRSARVVFGITVADVVEATDEKLTVRVPAGEPGSVKIAVTDSGGSYVLTNLMFQYYK